MLIIYYYVHLHTNIFEYFFFIIGLLYINILLPLFLIFSVSFSYHDAWYAEKHYQFIIPGQMRVLCL